MTQRRHPHPDPQQRTLVAQCAARLMLEHGVRDFASAKRKAAEQLGIHDRAQMPENEAIQHELESYQRLFNAQQQADALQRLRRTALEAMRLLERFRPCLVGPALEGGADAHTPVYLHLFADTAEEVMIQLMEQQIPFEQGERQVKYANGQRASVPKFSFIAGETEIQLTVFPPKGRRQAPLSPVDGRPQQRAERPRLEQLLADYD
ncbi:MAG: hypothetical protein ACQETD_03555 [Pseudomonadota bacterium]